MPIPREISAGNLCVLLTLLFPLGTAAQSTLPPTMPTVTAPATAAPVSPTTPHDVPAQVNFVNGKLEVIASGSSLNQILREVGRLASITITGTAPEERVFGSYGPGTPGDVISDLLDGSTNMLLRESTRTRPGELILTPRSGFASGGGNSNPAAQDVNRNPYLPPRQSFAGSVASPMPPPPQPYTVAPLPTTPEAQPEQQAPPQPEPSSTPQTPSGPQTPQQIYEQLQRLQQAQPHP